MMRDLALLIACEQGWPVFPLCPGRKQPLFRAAHRPSDPVGYGMCRGECGRVGHGVWDATTCPTTIRQWWRRTPSAGVGISCADLVVLDLDQPAGTETLPDGWPEVRDGVGALRHLAEQAGERVPGTLTVRTPSGGWHLYWQPPDGQEVPNRARVAPWVDTRARGGYVVAPGVVLPGGDYHVVGRRREPGPLPPWLTAVLTARPTPARQVACQSDDVVATLGRERHPRYLAAALTREADRVRTTPAGASGRLGRNHQLNVSAYKLGRVLAALDDPGTDHVRDVLLDAATSAGLPETEAHATIESGLAAGLQNPRMVRSA